MAHSVAKSCDAGRTPPSPSAPAQERTHVLFTLSGFQNRARFSYQQQQHRRSMQIKGLLAVGPTRDEEPLRMTPLCLLGLSCRISDSNCYKWFSLWRRALAILFYFLFPGPHASLSQPSETGGSGFAGRPG